MSLLSVLFVRHVFGISNTKVYSLNLLKAPLSRQTAPFRTLMPERVELEVPCDITESPVDPPSSTFRPHRVSHYVPNHHEERVS